MFSENGTDQIKRCRCRSTPQRMQRVFTLQQQQHHHHHIYFRLPQKPQKPIELATIKQQKENCKNQKIQKKSKKMILKM